MIYLVRCNNSAVTDCYLETIANMLSDDKSMVQNYSSDIKVKVKDIIIVATVIDFFRVYMKGYKKIIYWMQGIESEESFLKHNSKVRVFILDKFTKFALKRSTAVFYVSKAMKDYENNKFHIDTNEKSFIMPCFNTYIDIKTIETARKYEKNIFAYVGSLSKWQCFDKTLDFYKKIYEIVPNCELKIFTEEKERAIKLLEEKKIKKYHIDFVKPENLTKSLADVKFGFVLRDNIAVNNVATPTKLSSYMAAGVIPIYSDCLFAFDEVAKKIKFAIPIDENLNIHEKLINLCKENIAVNEVEKEYLRLFDTYYNPDYYSRIYRNKIRRIINDKSL